MKFFALLLFFHLAGTCCHAQSARRSPQELTGKWCYINETFSTADTHTNSCITLQEDGSYEATLDRNSLPNGTPFSLSQDTDRGTWWVEGNRLYYNSESTGEGWFVFQKQNHPRNESLPVIVVNGVMFATASSHNPW